MKASGILVIAFSKKDFIKKLPYAGYIFQIYDKDEIGKTEQGGFNLIIAIYSTFLSF